MNKIKIFTVALATTALLGCSDGLLTSPSTGDLVTPTHSYEIDTWMANTEIYEFTPKSNTSYTCVMVYPDNGASVSTQCFPKGEEL